MDIHKPKPWHNVRELAKEVGIIVVGIALALLGEQAVEWVHRQSEVAEARGALRSEIAQDAAAAQANVLKDKCLGVVLARVVAWSAGGPPPPRGSTQPFFTLGTSNWEVVKAGAAAQMPLDERLGYARFYDAVDISNQDLREEIQLALRFVGDAASPRPTPTEATTMAHDVAVLRTVARVRTAENLDIVQAAKAMGVSPAPLSADQRANLAESCAPVGIAPTVE